MPQIMPPYGSALPNTIGHLGQSYEMVLILWSIALRSILEELFAGFLVTAIPQENIIKRHRMMMKHIWGNISQLYNVQSNTFPFFTF